MAKLRADAQRSRAAILDAALDVLEADPDASVEGIATAAGVTRQTVYAHFPSRERLLAAVLDRLTEEAVDAMDAAGPDTGPAADAILRVLAAARRASARYPMLLRRFSSTATSAEEGREQHEPVADRLRRIVERGQHAGEFDRQPPSDWLVTVIIQLGHAAATEADAGRLSPVEAEKELSATVLRVLGAS
ncbi:TetR/AcrR family transcriptional regulator [Amycolatopsis sp. AA4]|uniref:TetR/AcrR family transcriptional regulator n=1 Tax=Actinomycetes TaxID=1760 RepID=UPI0001B57514|nr:MULTISPECIES: TetR/AcrR family transcriptional regulator [Actinomycetes]ATY11319.1 TetR/AcrR family transcriptional regulator [Amycolatopsis sp. AA4]EFL06920.1 predicted protein [Streptomyces sp. AA4]